MAEAKQPSPYRMIPVRPATLERLKDYKMRGATYDVVVNELMDLVPMEKFSKQLLREHRARLRTFEGRSWRDVRKTLKD